MTPTEAHNFISKCGRRWLGRKNLYPGEIVQRTKASLFGNAVMLAGMDFNSFYHSHSPAMRIVSGGFTLLALPVLVWLFLRLRQAERVVWRRYQLVKQ